MYLGNEIFYLGSLLPSAIYSLIKKYRQDYLYGNIMADTILAKRLLPRNKNSHSWEVAIELFESAQKDSEKAFCFGYMSHLAADTVAHGRYTAGLKNFKHAMLELRADRTIDSEYWYQAMTIAKRVQIRNDAFLEKSLERVIFSFKTNRRIFKGVVLLSGLNKDVLGAFYDRFPLRSRSNTQLKDLQKKSLDRIVDVLQNGSKSEVLKKDPIGQVNLGMMLKTFLT